jgi:septal ring factor EnvC (AmiA/AmiB activator)
MGTIVRDRLEQKRSAPKFNPFTGKTETPQQPQSKLHTKAVELHAQTQQQNHELKRLTDSLQISEERLSASKQREAKLEAELAALRGQP